MNGRWIAGVILVVLVGCGDSGNNNTPDAQTPVDRGRYLVNNVGLCGFCHTPILPDGTRDNTKLFAGMVPFADFNPDPAYGQINSANLTNHETGLKNRTDAQIKDAFLNGNRTDGTGNVVPIMPFWVFHNMSASDADAIVAYLRTLTPVDNAVPAQQPVMDGAPPWTAIPKQAVIDPSTVPQPVGLTGTELDSAMRGRYLASTIGLCIDCHTPEAAPMSLDIDRTRFFAGGKAFPKELLYGAAPGFPAIIFTANITPHSPTGIGTYTKQDIINVFKKGHAKDNTCLCAPTHGGPTAPYANMTDGDINDIATYLLALPPVENMAKPNECEATGMCQL